MNVNIAPYLLDVKKQLFANKLPTNFKGDDLQQVLIPDCQITPLCQASLISHQMHKVASIVYVQTKYYFGKFTYKNYLVRPSFTGDTNPGFLGESHVAFDHVMLMQIAFQVH